MSNKFTVDEMARLMQESRAQTRRLLFDMVIAERDLRRQPGAGFRPILWHLGHVGAFESYWILQRVKGDASLSPHYDLIFDPIKTPKDDSLNLPPLAEIEDYLDGVRRQTIDYLYSVRLDEEDPMLQNGYVFRMVLEHEYQHQETLLYLLQMLEPQQKRIAEAASRSNAAIGSSQPNGEMIEIPGGEFLLGAPALPFAYDNEQPQHLVELDRFRIDKFPVTNSQYAEFIQARGYHTRSLWSEEGWAWKEEHQVERPLYWKAAEPDSDAPPKRGWRLRDMFAEGDLQPHHPVTGLSWHEAESFARFVGKRLPTEAEWEKAASWNPVTASKNRFSWGDEPPTAELANFGNLHWGTTPVDAHPAGQSAYGCFDMTGNVWEWTATVFDAYPGFTAFPYREYSELWFDADHRVLKGGSWATREQLLRASFRNFWRPGFRIAFAGLRCAGD